MSMIYENENKEVCVQLYNDDYILIMNNNKSSILKVTSNGENLVVEPIKELITNKS